MVPEPAACPGLSTPAEEERAAGLSDRFLDILCTCTSPRGLHAGTSSNHILHLKLIITRKSSFAAQTLKAKLLSSQEVAQRKKKKALHEEKDEGDAKNIPLLHI